MIQDELLNELSKQISAYTPQTGRLKVRNVDAYR